VRDGRKKELDFGGNWIFILFSEFFFEEKDRRMMDSD
jgi:hypothetical protein